MTKIMKKNFLMILAVAAIWTGCSEGDVVEPNMPMDDALIQVRSTHTTLDAGGVATRAPYIGNISATNALETRVLSTKVSGDYAEANLHLNHKMTFSDNGSPAAYDAAGIDDELLLKFPKVDGSKLWLFGAYPFNGWSAPADNKIGFTFSGKEDVMVAGEVETALADVEEGIYASLAFKHLLTKIEVSLVGKSISVQGAWGNVTKVELIGVANGKLKNQVAVTLASPAVSEFTGEAASFPLYAMSKNGETVTYSDTEAFADPYVLTTTQTPVGYSIIAPFIAEGNDTDAPDLIFKVCTSKYPTGQEVKVALKDIDTATPFTGDTKGRAFSIVFSFDADTDLIQSQASITDWLYSGETVVPMV